MDASGILCYYTGRRIGIPGRMPGDFREIIEEMKVGETKIFRNINRPSLYKSKMSIIHSVEATYNRLYTETYVDERLTVTRVK